MMMNTERRVMLRVDSLKSHPLNPRGPISVDDPSLEELKNSISAHGILQPLTVLRDGTVVIGHRRLAAALALGVRDLPCIVRKLSIVEQLEIMLVENLQR